MAAGNGSVRSTLIVLALGISFDYAVHGQRFGLSTTLFFGLLAMVLAEPLRDTRSRSVLAGAAVVSLFPTVNASPSMATLDLLAVAGLLGIAAVVDAPDLAVASVRSLWTAAWRLLRSFFAVPAFVFRPVVPLVRRIDLGRAGPALRTVLVVVPIVGIFALLLGSADRVFADVITPPLPDWDLSSVPGHITLTFVGVLLAGTLWLAATTPRTTPAGDASRISEWLPPIGATQWTATLAGVVLLFAVFVVVQFTFLFGGSHRVLVTPDLTYAQYARSGFFQLIAVAVLVVGLVVAAWDLGEESNGRRFRLSATALIGLSFVILASAFMRLRLYEQTFGFTINRFFAYAAILWIAAVFASLLWCVWSGHRKRLFALALVAGLAVVIAVNTMNPERFVAQRNIDRWRVTGSLDTDYLSSLGADAVAPAVAVLPELPAGLSRSLFSALCSHLSSVGAEPSWRSWNAGRAGARQALRDAGVTAASCGSISRVAG